MVEKHVEISVKLPVRNRKEGKVGELVLSGDEVEIKMPAGWKYPKVAVEDFRQAYLELEAAKVRAESADPSEADR